MPSRREVPSRQARCTRSLVRSAAVRRSGLCSSRSCARHVKSWDGLLRSWGFTRPRDVGAPGELSSCSIERALAGRVANGLHKVEKLLFVEGSVRAQSATRIHAEWGDL